MQLQALKAALVLATTLAVAPVASAQSPSYVRVRNLTYAGTGCPAGSIYESVSSDLRALRLGFDSYVAEVGPGVPLSQGRKNCQIVVDLDYPSGWSYALAGVDVRGYVSLDPGLVASETSTYYFQGQVQSSSLRTSVTGPINRDYLIRDTLGLNSLVWSPCGAQRALNISTQVRIDNARNRSGRGLITLDSIEALHTQNYGLVWRRCF